MERIKKSKRHIIKENKYITMIILTNTNKNYKRLKIPKWLKYPFTVVLIIIISILSYFTYNTFNYIDSLEHQISGYTSRINHLSKDNFTKSETINQLKNVNDTHFKQLKEIQKQTSELQSAFYQLETDKNSIVNRLNSTEKTTETKPKTLKQTSLKSTKQSTISNIAYTSSEPKQNTNNSFEEQLNEIKNNLYKTSLNIEQEIGQYKELNTEVNELIPYWESYPSIYPANGYISSSYGWRKNPLGYGWEFHKGIDLANNYNTPIIATGNGKVISACYESGYGYTVTIDHGYGILTRYAHCNKLLVKKGQEVKRNETIAKMGSSGYSTGPHVHYEIKANGKHTNPLDYIYKEES